MSMTVIKFGILLPLAIIIYCLSCFIYIRKENSKALKEMDRTWEPFLKVLREAKLDSIVAKVRESRETVVKSSSGFIEFELDGKSCYLGGPPKMSEWYISITDKLTKEVWWYSSHGLDRHEGGSNV